ncbi:MAG: pyruvate dehydrogenase complex dihydrolipoamide acetyltransferase [Chitinophagaceae bacterium]
MAEVILMPRLSDTMTEGVIAAWHKKIGDPVKKGDLLAEIETDKATMELESYKDGTLLFLGGDKGSKILVDQLLAIVGAAGEDISTLTGGKPVTEKQLPIDVVKETVPEPTAVVDVSKMEEVVLMPRLSDTMEAGVIASWNKKIGDTVKKGEVLADIETDKATLELESYKNGTLLYIGAEKGEKIPVNGLLCIIGEKGKVDIDSIVAAVKGGVSPKSTTADSKGIVQPATTAVQSTIETILGDTNNGRVKASPLAKKIAKEKGVDLNRLQGSGDGGRIIKADIDKYKEQSATGNQQTVVSSQPSTSNVAIENKPAYIAPVVMGQEGYTDIPNSQIRNIIAKRLGESKFSAPHFYLTMEINMDNAIAARVQLNEISPAKISFNDLVVKAVAIALRQHPAINSSWMGDKIRRNHHIHIGVAVAIEDGLIVPVIRFADQKTLPQIAAESKELSGKAKNKKLQPNEFSGNTFTISNLGMMDIDEFTAIINPPDSCIMAVGRIKETVVKKGDGFGVSNFMKVTLSCDHRSVDGATGAAFLQTFKKYLENPITMLL